MKTPDWLAQMGREAEAELRAMPETLQPTWFRLNATEKRTEE